MIKKKIKNFNTFRFFNYKWKKVPSWGAVTAKQYTKWYLKRYGFKNIKTFKKFINNWMDLSGPLYVKATIKNIKSSDIE
jgi:hypothetical protein